MYLEDLSREDVISLGYKYLNGDEENGFFIDYEKAKFCFDFVGWKEDTEERINPDCDLLTADYYLFNWRFSFNQWYQRNDSGFDVSVWNTRQ